MNAQKYKTAKEREDVFGKFCANRDCVSCELHKAREKGASCEFMWLELEAEEEKIEEEKPLPCPFCGGEAIVVGTQVFYVLCNDCCGYVSQNESTKLEAIARHNRVAKAVMESEKEANNG